MSQTIQAIPWLLVVLLVLASCELPTPTPTGAPLAPPSTTPSSLPPTVAPSSPQPTDTPASSGRAAVTSTPTSAPPATPTSAATAILPADTSPRDGPDPLPDPLARLTLAPAGARAHDLLLDSATGRLHVTDTAGQLHILDAATYDELATLDASGALTLDADHDRLYVSPRYDEGEVTVVDTASLAVVDTVSPGGFVTVDSARNRFYVGNRIYGTVPAETPGVRVYDGATLEKLGEVPQAGIPVYNPLRDELYIVAYTVYSADPEKLEVTGDLLPEINAQPLAWCNGCLAATNAHVYPDRNLLVVEVTTLSAGKGPGTRIPPRFFDATNLAELTDLAELPPVERGCGERLILAEPVDSRVYRGEYYSRYVSYNNLLVYDLEGALDTWRDGLSLGITNPNTGQMYVFHGDDTLVLDLATLSPAGTLPPVCIHTLDIETGRIYALAGRDVVVYSELGAQPTLPPPSDAGPLPAEGVLSIQPSPDYAQDRTLFLTTSGKLYRSTDGGQTWSHLRGGLPEGDYLSLDLAISPDLSADGTLFVGGFRSDFWGEGVYRSTDGGDSWQPMWKDLTHLRVYDVVISPEYASDGTLLAYSRYQRLSPWHSGLSLFRSTDQGLSWTMVLTQPQDTTMPPAEEYLPPGPVSEAPQFRQDGYGQDVERTTDGAKTWQPLAVSRQPGFTVQTVLTSPDFERDGTVYILSEFDLFRSTDGGDTWARWLDNRLEGRDYTNKLTVATISPILGDGGHQLFVGTAAGELWTLEPAKLTWEPVQVAEQWPTVLEGEWVGVIETAPDGNIWLGTWGGGLAHYADGEIQARYTVTKGLPTQYIGGVAVAPDAVLWAGGDLPPSMASFDSETWQAHPFAEEDNIGGVLDVTVGPDGTVWVGAQAPGLLRWTGQDWELIADPEGLTGWRIYDIEVDSHGTLWCATARGLLFYSDGTWSGRGSRETRDVEFGPDNAAYLLASDGMVWRRAGGQWAELPPPKEGHFLSATALHVADDGAVWIGTQNGAFRFDGQAWQQFTAQDGLPANEVAAINQDVDGRLWFGTENGAGHVDPATLDLDPVNWPVIPTPTTQAGPTATPQVAPTPTPCALSPAASLAFDDSGQTADRLGCPIADAVATRGAIQPFEGGLMFWRANEGTIYVLSADGVWARYTDTWNESQPTHDPSLIPPPGLQQPVRGFGKVWHEQLGGPQADIGWALAGEQGYDILVQPFTAGQIFFGAGGKAYILYADGTWESHETP